jgi:hypothetical protein
VSNKLTKTNYKLTLKIKVFKNLSYEYVKKQSTVNW